MPRDTKGRSTERWLKVPAIADEQGNLQKRERGTPQGGVISPDDIIVHCRTKAEAELVRVNVAARLKQCGLELHPEKTKLVYCKDANRQESHPNE